MNLGCTDVLADQIIVGFGLFMWKQNKIFSASGAGVESTFDAIGGMWLHFKRWSCSHFLFSPYYLIYISLFNTTGHSCLCMVRFGSCCQTSWNLLTWRRWFKNGPPGGSVRTWQSASSVAVWEEEQGGAATTLTGVGVSLLGPERTGSEGELALHGRLGFPFLPQQLTPVQLRSFGERGQLVFALSENRNQSQTQQRCGLICELCVRVCVNNTYRTGNKLLTSLTIKGWTQCQVLVSSDLYNNNNKVHVIILQAALQADMTQSNVTMAWRSLRSKRSGVT